MSQVQSSEPKTIEGGPIVVEFVPPPIVKKSKKPNIKAKIEPREKRQKENLLTAKQFVEKYRYEAVTASWDPAVLRKCGRGAEDILASLGAERHKEKVPMRELDRRRQLIKDKEELEGTAFMDLSKPKLHNKQKKKKQKK
ncbi:hypothetical protein M9Y10_002153 [Tritrichomonas musculus]|uniref:Uncharacterized protein n=1 Tax=Tritrichomonas musculus TaxID=1915356 RepID=A0ABR2L8Z3_9EUKA